MECSWIFHFIIVNSYYYDRSQDTWGDAPANLLEPWRRYFGFLPRRAGFLVGAAGLGTSSTTGANCLARSKQLLSGPKVQEHSENVTLPSSQLANASGAKWCSTPRGGN